MAPGRPEILHEGGHRRAILAASRACGGIGRRARLRALWTEWSVEVRILSGALGEPRMVHGGAFSWTFSPSRSGSRSWRVRGELDGVAGSGGPGWTARLQS